MNALVTGSAGFLGRHFTHALQELGWNVKGIDLEARWNFGVPFDAVRTFVADGLREQFDLVIHCAAAGPNRKAIDMFPDYAPYNQLLDAAMFNWAIKTQQPRVLYISSSAVYSDDLRHPVLGGRLTKIINDPPSSSWMGVPFKEEWGFISEPFDVYGQTKRAGERLADIANQCGVKTTVVRPFSGYGSDQSPDFPFGAFIQRAKNREDPFVIWGNADQRRDFVHVDDIVHGSLALVEAGVTRPVNICTGVDTSMRELAEIIIGEVPASARYSPRLEVDTTAPMGVMFRIGDPTLFKQYYQPQWTVQVGAYRALQEALDGSRK